MITLLWSLNCRYLLPLCSICWHVTKFFLQVFDEIKIHPLLLKVSREGSELTSRFATQALEIIGYEVPSYYYWNVLNWSPKQVSYSNSITLSLPVSGSSK